MNIILPDYKQLAHDFFENNQKNLEVPEAKYAEAMLWLQRARAQYIALNRPAEEGDIVDIDFDTTVHNVPLEGGSGKHQKFVLGKGKFVPGFEERIQGMSIGETRTFTLTAPADYWLTELREKPLTFSVFLHNVQKEVLPELDDAFARSIGRFENLAELKKNIDEGLHEEQKETEKRRLRAMLLDVLARETRAPIEPEAIDREAERIVDEFKASLGSNSGNFLKYLAQVGKTEDSLKQELHGEAEKNITIALLLGHIAVRENITVSEGEITKKVQELIETSKDSEKPKKEDLPSLSMYVKNMLVAEKVLVFLEDQA
ncbi:MAG: trigger factor [Patescibacteria group bacterium]|nr:trigger factor [Patescibacteria group bacterium]MDE2438495.1 trigger factor [Patescibacteria group bacterium]